MVPAPLTVELPVCPRCGHVSKVPAGLFSGDNYCAGPKSAIHKRVRMEVRKFRELPQPKETA